MTNVMAKTCLNQEPRNYKNFEFVSGKKKLSEGRIYPKAKFDRVPKSGLNTRRDNREVTLTHLTRAQSLRFDK